MSGFVATVPVVTKVNEPSTKTKKEPKRSSISAPSDHLLALTKSRVHESEAWKEHCHERDEEKKIYHSPDSYNEPNDHLLKLTASCKRAQETWEQKKKEKELAQQPYHCPAVTPSASSDENVVNEHLLKPTASLVHAQEAWEQHKKEKELAAQPYHCLAAATLANPATATPAAEPNGRLLALTQARLHDRAALEDHQRTLESLAHPTVLIGAEIEPSEHLLSLTKARLADKQTLEHHLHQKQLLTQHIRNHHNKQPVPLRKYAVSGDDSPTHRPLYTPSDHLVTLTEAQLTYMREWEREKLQRKYAEDIWWDLRKPAEQGKVLGVLPAYLMTAAGSKSADSSAASFDDAANDQPGISHQQPMDRIAVSKLTEPTSAYLASTVPKYAVAVATQQQQAAQITATATHAPVLSRESHLLTGTVAVNHSTWKQAKEDVAQKDLAACDPAKTGFGILTLPSQTSYQQLHPEEVPSRLHQDTMAARNGRWQVAHPGSSAGKGKLAKQTTAIDADQFMLTQSPAYRRMMMHEDMLPLSPLKAASSSCDGLMITGKRVKGPSEHILQPTVATLASHREKVNTSIDHHPHSFDGWMRVTSHDHIKENPFDDGMPVIHVGTPIPPYVRSAKSTPSKSAATAGSNKSASLTPFKQAHHLLARGHGKQDLFMLPTPPAPAATQHARKGVLGCDIKTGAFSPMVYTPLAAAKCDSSDNITVVDDTLNEPTLVCVKSPRRSLNQESRRQYTSFAEDQVEESPLVAPQQGVVTMVEVDDDDVTVAHDCDQLMDVGMKDYNDLMT